MKINFEKLPCYTSIRKDEKVEMNVKFELANLLYTGGSGIAHGALAMKIYNSTGEEDYTEDECKILLEVANKLVPIFADSIKDLIEANNE